MTSVRITFNFAYSATIVLMSALILLPAKNAEASTILRLKSSTIYRKSTGGLSRLNLGMKSSNNVDAFNTREERCLKTARLIGTIAGSSMGIMQMYWSATGMSGVHGPFWKNVVTGAPAAVLGAYVGRRSTEWATKQIMKGRPKPSVALLKGALYGAIDGAIIMTTSFASLLIIGHYMETIQFNETEKYMVLKLLAASVGGGIGYGGTFGCLIGMVYGPYVSVYMRF